MACKKYLCLAKYLMHPYFLTFMAILVVFPQYSRAGRSLGEKLTVYTVNYPLKYFAERIAGKHARVVFPAPADVDPAFWTPDIRTLTDYQQADLILLNGASYAKWVNKTSLPRSKVMNTSAKFAQQYITNEDMVTHSHGPGGEHAHESIAFTTWMDFTLAAKQAKAILDGLCLKRPQFSESFRNNYQALERDLEAIDNEIKAMVAKDPSKPFVVSHPVYDYFERRYLLNIKSVHWEPDQVPSAGQLSELRDILKDFPAKWMIWEGEPTRPSVDNLKHMGVESLVFDPCGNSPEHGDFMSVMRKNVANFQMAFE